MSCDYCRQDKYGCDLTNHKDFIYSYIWDNKLKIEVQQGTVAKIEIEINYCPMCGTELNPNGITIQHMKLSDTHYNKLVDKYDKQTVDEVIESMKNYGKLKKYKNAYLTANKWCKKRFKDKSDGWGDVE
jgi:Zn-finger nucleic acid-binding protein